MVWHNVHRGGHYFPVLDICGVVRNIWLLNNQSPNTALPRGIHDFTDSEMASGVSKWK